VCQLTKKATQMAKSSNLACKASLTTPSVDF
jgi:hypothetical protein